MGMNFNGNNMQGNNLFATRIDTARAIEQTTLADTDRSGGVSRQELDAHAEKLRSQYFFAMLTNPQEADKIKAQLETVEALGENFNGFAAASGSLFDQEISGLDILTAANQDGDPFSISDSDLAALPTFPPFPVPHPPVPAPQLPVETGTAINAAGTADTDGSGGMNRQELTNRKMMVNLLLTGNMQSPEERAALEKELQALEMMEQNFDALAMANPLGANGEISTPDLFTAAGNDGNIFDISQQDLDALPNLFTPFPQPTQPGTSIPLATDIAQGFVEQMDFDRSGSASRQELEQGRQMIVNQMQGLQPGDPSYAAGQRRLEVFDTLLQHFDKLAGAGSNYGLSDGGISVQDIIAAAQRDGDASSISQADLDALGFTFR
ncbi:MAG: hypothetical protein KTR14_09990 [Vampirovibrio sp.]|nr:hypothetical protein [Vampirovibrio sp.]